MDIQHETKCGYVIWISVYKYGFQLFCRTCHCCISAVVHSFVMNSISAVAQAEGGQIPPDPQTHTIITCWFIHQGEYSIHFQSQANFSLYLYCIIYLFTFILLTIIRKYYQTCLYLFLA